MSRLNDLLDVYVPPAVPAGLAPRVAAAAAAHPQDRRSLLPWRRSALRGSWRRGTLIGGAVIGLVFTSAVAAEVVSGGRIEIPVAHQVVEAVPILQATARAQRQPVQLAAVERKHAVARPAVAKPDPSAASAIPNSPRERFLRKFSEAQQQVAERRAAGLPTPHADRIERRALQIVERRKAAGLPAPSVEEAEQHVALRQWRISRLLNQVARNPSAIRDGQIQRFARILPPKRREQFLALDPDQQRQQLGVAAQHFLARRAQRQMQSAQAQPVGSTNP